MVSHYNGDPVWISAKFDSNCRGCGLPIRRGDDIFWYPRGKTAYGSVCGCAEHHSGEFNSMRADEDVFNDFDLAY